LVIAACTITTFSLFRSIDLKRVIAYSSVSHINLCLIAILINTISTKQASFNLLLSHGVISSGLFAAIGYVYEQLGTRTLKYYSGSGIYIPF
jgi:NADH:ubiquinone oxidoreductase subunit 4 (subunit M)